MKLVFLLVASASAFAPSVAPLASRTPLASRAAVAPTMAVEPIIGATSLIADGMSLPIPAFTPAKVRRAAPPLRRARSRRRSAGRAGAQRGFQRAARRSPRQARPCAGQCRQRAASALPNMRSAQPT